MSRKPSGRRRGKHPDTVLLYICMALLLIGLVMVLSASSYKALIEEGTAYYYFKRQLLFAVLGLFAMFLATFVRVTAIKRLSTPALLVAVVLMVVVLLVGTEVDGGKRWLDIAGIRFAPAEIAKPLVLIAFAQWLTIYAADLHNIKGYAKTLALMMVVPALVVLEDLGTGVTIAGGLFCMMIIAGLRYRYIFATAGLGVIGIFLGIISDETGERRNRIIGFLDPFSPQNLIGDGWQLVQSLYGMGSGGLVGVGLGNSSQKLFYLPAMHTDFIFAVLAEETGFFGAVLVVLLFTAFVWRGFWIASKIKDPFMSLTAFGISASIGIQAFINIGVNVGVMPITGITLPFISYGGTSLVFILASVGLLLNMSRFIEK